MLCATPERRESSAWLQPFLYTIGWPSKTFPDDEPHMYLWVRPGAQHPYLYCRPVGLDITEIFRDRRLFRKVMREEGAQ